MVFNVQFVNELLFFNSYQYDMLSNRLKNSHVNKNIIKCALICKKIFTSGYPLTMLTASGYSLYFYFYIPIARYRDTLLKLAPAGFFLGKIHGITIKF